MCLGRALRTATVGSVVLFAVLLVSPVSMGPDWVRDVVVGNVVYLLPVAVLVHEARTREEGRGWRLVIAAGMLAFFAGNVIYLYQSAVGEAAFPSWADVGYLGIYPCLLAGLLLALRQHLRGSGLVVLLDGVIGMAAAAAVVAAAINPLVVRLWDGSAAAVVSVAYPVCDGLLVVASLSALGLVGHGRGRVFGLWAMGLLVFAVADMFYAYRVAFDTYQVGTWLDALWAAGFALVALGGSSAENAGDRAGIPGLASLVVLGTGGLAATVVLAVASIWHASLFSVVLALGALLGCGLRAVLSFVRLRDLATLRQQAMSDDLTGIANRRSLYQCLDAYFAQSADPHGARERHAALILIDLDRFKEVNDSFGHAVGDELLRCVVERFEASLGRQRTTHLLARLGGDEFALVLPDCSEERIACGVAQALQESLTRPMDLCGITLHVNASMGVALAPSHGTSRSDLLFAADSAMYAAKTVGDSVQVYSPATGGDQRRRLQLAEDLYAALERDELNVVYQPITTVDQDVVGVEALVRWDHPVWGRLAPMDFLGVAEHYRLTPAVAKRVLAVALRDLASWRARGAELSVSVNVSPSDVRDEGLIDAVATALMETGLPGHALTIEVTESAIMQDPQRARAVFAGLRELGVRLAIDDYGTGYSSLEYLYRLPIDELKLDRTFIQDLVTDRRAAAIVGSTIELTHALGLRMVAEGVEDEPTLAVLRDLGTDLVQGWHVGRPVSPPTSSGVSGSATSTAAAKTRSLSTRDSAPARFPDPRDSCLVGRTRASPSTVSRASWRRK